MGLDTTHDCWHGAYSAFKRWREKLAEVVGIPLPLMEGFYGEINGAQITGPPVWARYAFQGQPTSAFREAMDGDLAWLPIGWDALKPDVLHKLLHHSDCDGEILAETCGPLADRLEQLLPLLDGDGGGHIGSYRTKTEQFIRGLRLAASRGEAVEFH